jgi:beta-galactosidase
MNLGVQYYRAPFPQQKYWEKDFSQIKASGLNTVQLWVLWSWVEAKPDCFNFEDYDRLIELADKNGLKVILSTIAELQPLWIHRLVPDSEMIDHEGKKVISTNRCECHFGITPGGCTDHPGVWERMCNFLTAVTERYKDAPNLSGWDAWNELRWNVQADGLVCFCPSTLAAFRKYLERRYHNLENLNAAWKRRYVCWEDVMPGKLPDRPYTELITWQNFLTERANQHGKQRYELMKAIDSQHPITVHGAAPSPLYSGDPETYPIDRGNDWVLADKLDGIGCSSFPQWEGIDDAGFGMRIEMVKSAARDKQVWLSELQGGRAAVGFNIYGKVEAAQQQHWLWNGLACGADTILFWCWRDEVFGRESAGFGLAGRDGLAKERLSAMRLTGELLEQQKKQLAGYRPASAEVGILFSPTSYYLAWAQEGTAARIADALTGYARALVRRSIPCQFVEDEHLEQLERFKLIVMPHGIVTEPHQEEALATYVQNGGTLLCESECGAFNATGLYRYPEERFPAEWCGLVEAGRRVLPENPIEVNVFNRKYKLAMEQWVTPLENSYLQGMEVWAEYAGQPLIAACPVGKGRIIYCGSYLGNAYHAQQADDFETLLADIVFAAGGSPAVRVITPKPTPDKFVYVKYGSCADGYLLFIFFPEGVEQTELELDPELFPHRHAVELWSDQKLTITDSPSGQLRCTITPGRFGLAVIAGH